MKITKNQPLIPTLLTFPPTILSSMETSPNKRQRQASLKGKKKGGKALQRLRSLKGEVSEDDNIESLEMSVGANDRGFRDVRTLTEKMRMLSWVRTS